MRALPVSTFWLKLIGAFFVVFFLVVWEHVEARRLERQVIVLRREVDRLTYETALLRTQIHQRTTPSHLDAAARKDFGMEPVDPKRVIGLSTP